MAIPAPRNGEPASAASGDCVPGAGASLGAEIERLDALVACLRDPERGCPWDQVQQPAAMAGYLLEEAYEVRERVLADDPAGAAAELGDVLFNACFLGQLFAERGGGDLADSARAIRAKMVRRHPHVFAGAPHDAHLWARDKARERAAAGIREDTSALAGVSVAQPALARALALQRHAARVGFDWRAVAPVLRKLEEELGELAREIEGGARERQAAELGDVLFSAVNLARHLGLDPDASLAAACRRFEARFREVERLADSSPGGLAGQTDAELEALWQRAKAAESSASSESVRGA